MKDTLDLSVLKEEQREIVSKLVELSKENKMLKDIIRDLTKLI